MSEPMNMKCPFRQCNGEFLDCYGPACMAYYEYAPPPVAFGQTNSCMTGQTPVSMCKKMLAYAPYSRGCT